jgi:flagellar basal-body rod modification protein FlgD
MATIDSSSPAQQTANAQKALFDKLGISSETDAAKRATSSSLGQDDFLKLMTAQLQNQDPFAPMENGDFIAQMAQFSTVSGIQEVNANLVGMSDEMKQMRISTASNLLGHSVLIPGNVARPDENGELHGVVDLPSASSSTSVIYTDVETGELLLNHELGPVRAGLVGFNWTDVPKNVIDGKKLVKIEIQANTGDGVQNFGPSVYARVLATSAGGSATDGVMLDVEDYGDVNVNNVVRFR